jgi:hypothetical protein
LPPQIEAETSGRAMMRPMRILPMLLTMAISALPSTAQEPQDSLKDLARRNGGTIASKVDVGSPATPLRELTQMADVIIRGRLTSMVTRLSDDESTVFRDFTVTVSSILKESPELIRAKTPGPLPTFTLRQIGGTIIVDGLKLTTITNYEDREAPMDAGQEYVLFLSKAQPSPSTTMTTGAGVYSLTSTHFGAYPIRAGKVGNLTKSVANRSDRKTDDPSAFVAAIRAWVRPTR